MVKQGLEGVSKPIFIPINVSWLSRNAKCNWSESHKKSDQGVVYNTPALYSILIVQIIHRHIKVCPRKKDTATTMTYIVDSYKYSLERLIALRSWWVAEKLHSYRLCRLLGLPHERGNEATYNQHMFTLEIGSRKNLFWESNFRLCESRAGWFSLSRSH